MKRLTCRFLRGDGKCEIGCKSIGILERSPCPYLVVKDEDELCPCHHGGLTFILAERANKLIKDIIGGHNDRRDD